GGRGGLCTKLEPRGAAGLQHRDLLRLEPDDLRLDEVMQAPGHVALEYRLVRSDDDAIAARLDPPASDQVVHRGDEEQRVPVGVRVQQTREPRRRRSAAESQPEPALDTRERQATDRYLDRAAAVYERPTRHVERPCARDGLRRPIRPDDE